MDWLYKILRGAAAGVAAFFSGFLTGVLRQEKRQIEKDAADAAATAKEVSKILKEQRDTAITSVGDSDRLWTHYDETH